MSENAENLPSSGRLVSFFNNHYCSRAEICDSHPGNVVFYFKDGSIKQINIGQYTLPDIPYLKQFGLSISEDSRFFFVQSWEKGLFCFDIQSETLVWHNKRKKAYQLAICGNSVICRFFDDCINKIDIATGSVLSHFPLGAGTSFHVLNKQNSLFLVGPKRSRYYVIDNNLEVAASIPMHMLNPHKYNNFIITSASCTQKGVLISGYEYDIETVLEQYRSLSCVPMVDYLFYRELEEINWRENAFQTEY
jgi:hypothetical protein